MSYTPKIIPDLNTTRIAPALCLDIDGTVRYSTAGDFIKKRSDIALYDGVEEMLWVYRGNGYVILGISNQGGLAFGIKTPEQENDEMAATLALFNRNPFDLIHACWHHTGGTISPLTVRSLCRKPDYGMLVACELEMAGRGVIIDWNRSLMVGDRPEDQQCALNAGVRFQWAAVFFNRAATEDREE